MFAGNPAAVVPLESWLDDATLQAIAAENNLSETAFLVPDGAGADYAIRWMTPTTEVDLCGHATLAAAYTLFHEGAVAEDHVTFSSASGPLVVSRDGECLTLDFPCNPTELVATPAGLADALGCDIAETHAARNYLLVPLSDQPRVETLEPDFAAIAGATPHPVIVTAPGASVDFVSRFFAPRQGIPEDPVTGSAHCVLAPYWAHRLGKTSLRARQCSTRGGEMLCEVRGDRVHLSGYATLYLKGEIQIP